MPCRRYRSMCEKELGVRVDKVGPTGELLFLIAQQGPEVRTLLAKGMPSGVEDLFANLEMNELCLLRFHA